MSKALGVFEKCCWKYTLVRFCKITCMSAKKMTIYIPNPGGSVVRRIEAMTESSQQHGARRTCWASYRLPRTMLLKSWHSVKWGEGNYGGEALASGLLYLFLTCGGSIDNVVTPPRNHQTGSMRIKPPNEVVWFRNRFDSHSTNRFRCGRSQSGFAPRLHLVYTFECASMRIAFASVDRPLVV